jgi:5-methylcytosine-specific restriction endonuclease McrA
MSLEGEPGLAFAEKLLGLLDSGRYTATYKFATLIALIDVCVEEVDAAGDPPERISAARVGRRVLELMWRHALPYDSKDGEDRYLSHSTQANDLVAKITRFRRDHDLGPGAGVVLASRLYPVAFEALQDEVVTTVIRMPLPRLQRFGTGSQEDRFLYDFRWPDEVSASRVRSADFDDGLYLRPGVGEWLVRLAGLLRPIIQGRWAAFVADRSEQVVEVAQLDRFLFGASRINLGGIREPLVAAQGHECFYCLERLVEKVAEVDHFVPWSRHPDDGLDNLVAAHRRCNNAKRDSLAATTHLGRWIRRFGDGTEEASVVTGLAADLGWPRRPAATLGSARAAYLWLPAGTLLWDAPDRYLPADPAGIRYLFGNGLLATDRDTDRPARP